jgi:hypothetical protein
MSKLKINYALGGQGEGKQFSTGLILGDQYGPGEADTRAFVATLVPIFTDVLCKGMFIYSETVSDDTLPRPPRIKQKLPTVMDTQAEGERVVGNGDAIADVRYVAVWELLAEGGRGGRIELRGALLKSEIDISINGVPSLKVDAVPAWATAFANALKAQTANGKVMLGPGGDKRTAKRPIIDVKWVGVYSKEITNTRVSPEVKKRGALRSELIEMSNDYRFVSFDEEGNPVVPSAPEEASFTARATAIKAENGGVAGIRKARVPANIAKFFKS